MPYTRKDFEEKSNENPIFGKARLSLKAHSRAARRHYNQTGFGFTTPVKILVGAAVTGVAVPFLMSYDMAVRSRQDLIDACVDQEIKLQELRKSFIYKNVVSICNKLEHLKTALAGSKDIHKTEIFNYLGYYVRGDMELLRMQLERSSQFKSLLPLYQSMRDEFRDCYFKGISTHLEQTLSKCHELMQILRTTPVIAKQAEPVAAATLASSRRIIEQQAEPVAAILVAERAIEQQTGPVNASPNPKRGLSIT